MALKDKFKNFKWSPKTIIAVSVASVIVIGTIVGVKVALPALVGGGKSELHVDSYAELDCTDAASDAFSEAIGSNVRCQGEVVASFHLTMDEGQFTLELDRDALDQDLEEFVFENTDAILKNQLASSGVNTDAASLNEYAVSIGYADWTAAVNATADSLTGRSFERLTEGEISYKGTYEIGKDDVAAFSDSKGVLFTASREDDGTVVIDYSFDRQAPEFMYDYFKRGVDLVFDKGASKSSRGANGSSGNDGVSVNFILETVPTEPTETTPETTPEPTPEPTPAPSAQDTNPDGTPVETQSTNPDGTPIDPNQSETAEAA